MAMRTQDLFLDYDMRRRLLASQRYNGIDIHRASRRDSTGKERNKGQDQANNRETKWIMLVPGTPQKPPRHRPQIRGDH
jgi:hypothetical protein